MKASYNIILFMEKYTYLPLKYNNTRVKKIFSLNKYSGKFAFISKYCISVGNKSIRGGILLGQKSNHVGTLFCYHYQMKTIYFIQ